MLTENSAMFSSEFKRKCKVVVVGHRSNSVSANICAVWMSTDDNV